MINGELMILMNISIKKTWNADMPNKLLEKLIFDPILQNSFKFIIYFFAAKNFKKWQSNSFIRFINFMKENIDQSSF